ncbi:MAG: SDR family NAD(P)-dependent oxidoreductase [Caldilineaceae bacterium]|nr:SDR family NAD(P)-dependent oxidoreductase [Caldilineaceae bacterium]
MLNLQGKTAVVTGASSGFGAATARALATRGARVALMARTESALDQLAGEIECASGCVRAIPVDVANTDALGAAYEEAADRLGPIEILVNNAGTNVAPRRYADTSLDQWRTVLAVNLDAAFLLTKLVMPGMRELGRGSIVNVASRAANYPSLLAGVSYSSSKLGMAALNRIANEEGNPFGIRAILVNPGVGATPILDRRPEPPPQEMRNRMLQAEDVADTIVFAVSLPYRACLENIDVYPTDPDVR